jgi:hypothetical protein
MCLGVTVDGVWIGGLVDHLYTPLRTTSNNSDITDLHTLQNITVSDKPFPACCVFTSHSLATASNGGDTSASHVQVLVTVACEKLLLTVNYNTICFQPPLQNSTDWLHQFSSFYNHFYKPSRKHFSNSNCIVVFIFIAVGMGLLIHWLETGCIIQLFICLLHSNGCTLHGSLL